MKELLSFARACKVRDIDGWAGLILSAWEEISLSATPEEAVERIAAAGFDPPVFVRMVRMAEEWKNSRGRKFDPRRKGGMGDIDARYEFRVDPEGNRFRASIVQRNGGEVLWDEIHSTAARALGAMAREGIRLRGSGSDPTEASEETAELESARVWLDEAENEYSDAVEGEDAERRARAAADVEAARRNYVRVLTHGSP